MVEKIPFFALSAVVGVVTLATQSGAVRAGVTIPLWTRLGNALVSGAVYPLQMVYPARLAVVYPYPIEGIAFWKILLALGFFAGMSALAFVWRRKRPYFAVGWLWYLIMLLPVIGLVQVGAQAHADRYTYLPQIGLLILLTWLVAEGTASWRNRRWVLGAGAGAALAVCLAAAHAQTRYWRDSETLWRFTLANAPENPVAENNLADALLHKGQFDDAIEHGSRAIQLDPRYAEAHNCLGFALLLRGRIDEAIGQFEAALREEPGMARAHSNLGFALLQQDRPEEAKAHYEKALEIEPGYLTACNNLAWLLATSTKDTVRDGPRAVALAQKAVALSGGTNPMMLRTLAAAYAEGRQFPEAVAAATQAQQQASALGNSGLADLIQKEIALYQEAQPVRGVMR